MALSVTVSDTAPPQFPYKCAACLAPAVETHSILVRLRETVYLERKGEKIRAGHHDHQLEFDIPYCQKHLQASLRSQHRMRHARHLRVVLALLTGAGLAGGVAQALYMYTNLLEQQTPVAVGILAGVFVVALFASLPVWLVPAAAFVGVGAPCRALFRPESHSTLAVGIIPPPEKRPEGGTIQLRFANRHYGELFCQVNGVDTGGA